MALLTTEQQNALWTNRTESVKKYDSVTQDANTFECYCFYSKLDGHNYYVNLMPPTVDHNTDAATVEAEVKAVLATMEYIEPITETTSNV